MEWIKVENKLPEVDKKVLVLINHTHHDIDTLKRYEFEEITYSFKYGMITHWMPLPEPPRQPKLTWQYELKSEPGVWKDATDDEYKAGCDLIRMNWRQVEK